MRPPISFFVSGHPKGQPRARSRQFGKGVYDPGTADGWKACVRADWKALNEPAWEGPLKVSLVFYFARPAAHFGSGKNALNLKPSAPRWFEKKPDRDNLDKAVLDALTNAGAWADDCQAVAGSIRKLWAAPDASPGVRISISEAPDDFNPSDN
jgi:Holliday junction resolvase RusA-like endonuclease